MDKGFSVFVLEKDQISSMILKSKLVENHTIDVLSFHSPEECASHLNNNPSVVVIHNDVHGQYHKNGIALMLQMKEKRPDTKFILVSDKYNRQLMFDFINDRNVNYIARSLPNFSSKVKELVEGMFPQNGQSRFVA